MSREKRGTENVLYHHATQPVVEAVTGKLFGHEILLRCQADGKYYEPDQFRALFRNHHLDWARVDIQMTNEVLRREKKHEGALLFNMSPQTSADNGTLLRFLSAVCQVKDTGLCDNAGIEINENLQISPGALINLISTIQSYGLLACLDDYDNGRNNIDRITTSRWDVFKIDWRPTQRRHFNNQRINRLCDILQPNNTMVLIEGVETIQDHETLADTRIDLVQGFHYGRPAVQSL